MYTQFFGNYLLDRNAVTQQQLFDAMQKQSSARMKLGTLAMHAGYMTATEVDNVVIQQTHKDQKFGELAVDMGYLTNEQVMELLKSQSPDFLLLGQILVEDGVLTNSDLETLMTDYRSDNEMIELDMTADNHEIIQRLLTKFFVTSEIPPSRFGVMFVELLFNNFVRFVGEDFTILNCVECDAYPVECCVKQSVLGDYSITSYLSMEEATAIEFASRYAGESFEAFDEYVQAAMEDFLNLHNGLFIVNVSNESSIELSISAPEVVDGPIIDFTDRTYLFPVLYSFGNVHFIFEIHKIVD